MSSGLVTSDAPDLQSKSSVLAQDNTPSSPLSSPPSTPTPATVPKMAASKGEVTSADEMPPPPKPDASSKPSTVSRKRSREMVDEEGYLADGSQAVAGPTSTSRSSKRKGSTESATTIVKISQSQAEAEAEAKLQPDAETPSQKVPPSGQGQASAAAAQPAKTKSKDKQKNAKAPQKAKSAPQEQPATQDGEGNGTEYETDTDASDSDESVPEEQIKDFDWTDLETRYHEKIQELGEQEHQLMGEFNQLMDVSDAVACCYISVLTKPF